jgi:hypothetical protein
MTVPVTAGRQHGAASAAVHGSKNATKQKIDVEDVRDVKWASGDAGSEHT